MHVAIRRIEWEDVDKSIKEFVPPKNILPSDVLVKNAKDKYEALNSMRIFYGRDVNNGYTDFVPVDALEKVKIDSVVDLSTEGEK